ncbi:MAG: ACT domain-containing protein [Candidatus Lokiarchaeota archaeon]|nr:ACT domain-containing protein [Candidatus Lokiarchaeota archaeon]
MKAIVSVVGLDKPGIVATVSTTLANYNINIIDITQSYAHDFFTMLLIVDFEKSNITLKEISEKLKEAGDKIGVFVTIQHEDVFRAMHRI